LQDLALQRFQGLGWKASEVRVDPEDALFAEAGIERHQIPEAAHEQKGADNQDQ